MMMIMMRMIVVVMKTMNLMKGLVMIMMTMTDKRKDDDDDYDKMKDDGGIQIIMELLRAWPIKNNNICLEKRQKYHTLHIIYNNPRSINNL